MLNKNDAENDQNIMQSNVLYDGILKKSTNKNDYLFERLSANISAQARRFVGPDKRDCNSC